jgi:hypothetical protein
MGDHDATHRVWDQVQAQLLKDFAEALKNAEADALKKSSPLTELQRREIMMGFAQGALRAAAEVGKQAGMKYLHWIVSGVCAGANVRILTEAEEKLHQLAHTIVLACPDGEIPDIKIGALPFPPFLRRHVPEPEVDPKDLN